MPRVFGEQIDNHDVFTCLRLESGAVVSARASDARCEGLRAAFAIKLKGRNRYTEQLNEIARRRRKGHYDGRVRHQHYDWNAWKPISGASHVLGSDENNRNDAQRYMPEIGHQHYDMPGIRLRLALDV